MIVECGMRVKDVKKQVFSDGCTRIGLRNDDEQWG